ncbi:hypothetical protein [uncultured Marivita sp.]|nr:hypothetical protein [uncultured Marivita sp.]
MILPVSTHPEGPPYRDMALIQSVLTEAADGGSMAQDKMQKDHGS